MVEDDTMFRKGLVRALNKSEALDCNAGFGSYEDMFDHVEVDGHAWPQVILMDIGLLGGSGLEGIRILTKKAPEVKALVLTVFSNKEKLMDAIDAALK